MAMPHWAYLRNQLKAVRPPLESDRGRAQAFLDAVPVSYVLLTFEGAMLFVNDEIAPLVEGNPQAWKVVYGMPRDWFVFMSGYGRIRRVNEL